ncbi:hypothetical protein H0H93_013248 [Arthromyces matolae]|nr:hypothetical protein H0H93_013247 [Arthromyces matolae]KAG6819298.1 hypothetical protein H0H93_013248 [Arthromyces matolae]
MHKQLLPRLQHPQKNEGRDIYEEQEDDLLSLGYEADVGMKFHRCWQIFEVQRPMNHARTIQPYLHEPAYSAMNADNKIGEQGIRKPSDMHSRSQNCVNRRSRAP